MEAKFIIILLVVALILIFIKNKFFTRKNKTPFKKGKENSSIPGGGVPKPKKKP